MWDPKDITDNVRKKEKEAKDRKKMQEQDEMTDYMNPIKGGRIKQPKKNITGRNGKRPIFNSFFDKNVDLSSIRNEPIPKAPNGLTPGTGTEAAVMMDKVHDTAGSANPADYGMPSTQDLLKMSPEEVKEIQRGLNARGYPLGDYGTKTKNGYIGDDGKPEEFTINALRQMANDQASGKSSDKHSINPLSRKDYTKGPGNKPKAEDKNLDVIKKARDASEKGFNPLVAAYMDKPVWDEDKEKRIKNAGTWSAIGSALRNVIDAAGGSQGADIWRHQYSPLAAVTDNLTKMKSQYASEVDDYEKAQQDAAIRQQGYRFKDDQRQKQNQFQKELTGMREDIDSKQWERRQQITNKQRENLEKLKTGEKKEYAKYKAKLDAALDDKRMSNDMKLALAKASLDADSGKDDGFFHVTQGNGEQVKIPEGTYYDIINRIMDDVNSGNINDPDLQNDMSVLNLALEGKGSKNALNIKVAQYWDKYYKQDQQTGDVVSNEYSQKRDQQFQQQIMTDVEQDIREAQGNPERAVMNIAGTLVVSGIYEDTPEGREAAIQQAKQLHEEVQARNKNMQRKTTPQEPDKTTWDGFTKFTLGRIGSEK